MPVPPDGRHPLYPNTPRHLNPRTAEIKAVPLQPRHRHAPPPEHVPTAHIPRIDANREQYPPKKAPEVDTEAWRKAAIVATVAALALFVAIVLLAIYVGTHI